MLGFLALAGGADTAVVDDVVDVGGVEGFLFDEEVGHRFEGGAVFGEETGGFREAFVDEALDFGVDEAGGLGGYVVGAGDFAAQEEEFFAGAEVLGAEV